jgi:hypothetical protein
MLNHALVDVRLIEAGYRISTPGHLVRFHFEHLADKIRRTSHIPIKECFCGQISPSAQHDLVPHGYDLEDLQPLCDLSDVVYRRIRLGLAEEDAKGGAR